MTVTAQRVRGSELRAAMVRQSEPWNCFPLVQDGSALARDASALVQDASAME